MNQTLLLCSDNGIEAASALIVAGLVTHFGVRKADGPARKGAFILSAILICFALSEVAACYWRWIGLEMAAAEIKLLGAVAFFVLTICLIANHPYAPDMRGVRKLEVRAQLLEEKVAQLTRELEDYKRQHALRSNTIASLSLELRSPLSAILGLSELLLGAPLNGEQRDLVVIAQESGQVMLGLLNDTADLAEVAEGNMRLRLSPLNLAQTVKEALSVCSEEARRKRLSLNSDVDPRLPPELSGDASRLRQVLVYLVRHAIRRTDKGGITLGAYADPSSPKTVRFVVSGTESFLTDEDKTQVMELIPDGKVTRQYGGWALQLYLSRRLIELMGGTLKCGEDRGKPMLFSFAIPLSAGGETAALRT